MDSDKEVDMDDTLKLLNCESGRNIHVYIIHVYYGPIRNPARLEAGWPALK